MPNRWVPGFIAYGLERRYRQVKKLLMRRRAIASVSTIVDIITNIIKRHGIYALDAIG